MGYMNLLLLFFPQTKPDLVIYLGGGNIVEKNKPKFILVKEQSFASKYTESGVENTLSFN